MLAHVEDREISFNTPDLLEMLYENASYVGWLARKDKEHGRDAVYRFVEAFLEEFGGVYGTNLTDYVAEICETLIVVRESYLSLSKFRKRLAAVKLDRRRDKVRAKLPLARLGKTTVEFSPYTYFRGVVRNIRLTWFSGTKEG